MAKIGKNVQTIVNKRRDLWKPEVNQRTRSEPDNHIHNKTEIISVHGAYNILGFNFQFKQRAYLPVYSLVKEIRLMGSRCLRVSSVFCIRGLFAVYQNLSASRELAADGDVLLRACRQFAGHRLYYNQQVFVVCDTALPPSTNIMSADNSTTLCDCVDTRAELCRHQGRRLLTRSILRRPDQCFRYHGVQVCRSLTAVPPR